MTMTAKGASSQDALRLRAIATMEPLLRLRATGTLEWLDHRDIAMFTLGCLLDSWNLGAQEEMMTRDDVARRIAERVSLQAVAASRTVDAASARDYGTKVVDALLNHDSQTGEFVYSSYDHDRGTFETYSFHLLRYEEALDNRIYVVPSAEASNLYFQSFLVDVQDELLGQRHALEHHIRSGRTDRLAAAAEAHRRTASRLLAQTRNLSRRADRSIRTVSPLGDVAPLLEEIHLAAREAMGFDDGLKSKLSEQLAVADDDASPHIQRALAALKGARHLFLSTKNAAAEMLVRLERASADAAFRGRRRGVAVPELDREVAVPLMSAPLTEELTDAILCALLGATLPELPGLDVVMLAEKCLPPAPKLAVEDDEDEDFRVPVSPLVARFGANAGIAAEALDFVARYGAAAGSLSRVLSHPEAITRGDAFGEALSLVVNAAFKDQGGTEGTVLRLPGLRLHTSVERLPAAACVAGTDVEMERIA